MKFINFYKLRRKKMAEKIDIEKNEQKCQANDSCNKKQQNVVVTAAAVEKTEQCMIVNEGEWLQNSISDESPLGYKHRQQMQQNFMPDIEIGSAGKRKHYYVGGEGSGCNSSNSNRNQLQNQEQSPNPDQGQNQSPNSIQKISQINTPMTMFRLNQVTNINEYDQGVDECLKDFQNFQNFQNRQQDNFILCTEQIKFCENLDFHDNDNEDMNEDMNEDVNVNVNDNISENDNDEKQIFSERTIEMIIEQGNEVQTEGGGAKGTIMFDDVLDIDNNDDGQYDVENNEEQPDKNNNLELQSVEIKTQKSVSQQNQAKLILADEISNQKDTHPIVVPGQQLQKQHHSHVQQTPTSSLSNKNISQKSSAAAMQASSQHSSRSSIQKTVTINEQSFATKLYSEYEDIIESSPLHKSFMSHLKDNQSNYRPYYRLLTEIFRQAKLKSNHSIENIAMYADFFKAKLIQLDQYIKEMQNPKIQEVYQGLSDIQINNLVYVDSKVVLRDIHQRSVKKVKRHKAFYKKVSQISKQLNDLCSNVKQGRFKRQKVITQILSAIDKEDVGIQKLIDYLLNKNKANQQRLGQQSKSNKNSIEQHIKQEDYAVLFSGNNNPHLRKDLYLQVRYLQEKENDYLSKLTQLRIEVMKYLTSIFLTQQVIMASKIKQALVSYADLMVELDRHYSSTSDKKKLNRKSSLQNNLELQQNQNSLQKDKFDQIEERSDALESVRIQSLLKYQLGQSLFNILSQELRQELGIQNQKWSKESSQQDKLTSEKLLDLLNLYFQNQMFMKNIQMNKQFIFFDIKGIWFSKQEYQAVEQAQIFGSSNSKSSKTQVTQTKVKIILSVDRYFHIQKEGKLATMKLGEIKVSKKGRYLIISDKGKGIVGFLVNNGNQLGRIKFENIQQVDRVCDKIKLLLTGKSS